MAASIDVTTKQTGLDLMRFQDSSLPIQILQKAWRNEKRLKQKYLCFQKTPLWCLFLLRLMPIVSASTKKPDNKVEAGVMDNGSDIPQKVLDKIFQPFFTTKPTGLGTGWV